MSPRFTIGNREALEAERRALVLARHVARALTTSDVVERFEWMDTPPAHADWIVFKDLEGRGFAMWLDDAEDGSSPLQRALCFVRHARATVSALGGAHSLPCALTLEREPPREWSVWRLDGVSARVWFAASCPVIDVPRLSPRPHRDPKVRVRMYGVFRDVEGLEVGALVECQMIDVWMPEIGIRGRCVCGGEGMSVEIDEGEWTSEQQIPGVRLDLGEIEMRLSDLVGLRPGAVINLGEVALERCFVRLGATVLAEGRFQTSGGRLLLTIESVL